MTTCNNCKAKIENDSNFCINCGEKIIKVKEDKKLSGTDISWYFLLFALIIGIVTEFFSKRIELKLDNINFFEFLSVIFEKAPLEFYAEILGASFAKVLIPSIIIGFIWGIKSLMSKKYEKPILHIFIGTIIISIISLFGS